MKKINRSLLVLLIMTMFSFLLFVQVYSKKGDVSAIPTQQKEHNSATYSAPASGVSRIAIQKYASADIETVAVNGVEMSVSNFRIEGRYLKVNVCFEYPNNKEWNISEGLIQFEDRAILLLGAATLEISQTLDDGRGRVDIVSGSEIRVEKMEHSVPNYRCNALQFTIEKEEIQQPTPASLTIKNIRMFPKGGQGCFEFLETVQRTLDQNRAGIRIDCQQTEVNHGFVITKKLSNVSQDEAMKTVLDAYRASFTVTGPWVFTGVVAPDTTEVPTETATP